MRRVLHGDVTAAGRALLAVTADARPDLLARMIAEADAADTYRQATGRAHPLWGGGSLMGVALTRAHGQEPFLDDPEYAACLVLVFEALVARGGGEKPFPKG